jgi:NAD(P)H-dependent flavin oxidoreductase YrpB (nitropropane dioxygenase family)
MSAMTMPIPAIVDNGLMEVAEGLKAAGSLMWTGTPIPQDLKDIASMGVSLAANVKPFEDRKKMFQGIEEIQAAGVQWVGIEVDSGQGTKVKDRQMASDCTPLTLKELKEIRDKVSRPLIFKGVLSRDDAIKSIDAGADGILVSNHGAHTLDYLPHPFQVMDEIVRVARGKTVIMVDGGFRRGSDVLKGLSFGASLVGLGRPILYALASYGSEGVKTLIGEITNELKRLMSMVGAPDPSSVGRDVLIED